MEMRWPFPLGQNKRAPDAITPEQMAEEIETFTTEEQQTINRSFKERYLKRINARLKFGSRIRRRIENAGFRF